MGATRKYCVLGFCPDCGLRHDAELHQHRGRIEVTLHQANLSVSDLVDVAEVERDRAAGGRDLACRRLERAGLRSLAGELEDDVVARCDHVVDLHSAVGEAVRPHLGELDRARGSAIAGVRAHEHDLTVGGHELGDLVELPLVPVVIQAARDTHVVLRHRVLLSLARRAHLLTKAALALAVDPTKLKGCRRLPILRNTCSGRATCPATSAAPRWTATRETATRAIPSAGSSISSSSSVR